MSESELKRCPFCGSKAKAVYFSNGSLHSIQCTRCLADMTITNRRKPKIAAWNRRAGEGEGK